MVTRLFPLKPDHGSEGQRGPEEVLSPLGLTSSGEEPSTEGQPSEPMAGTISGQPPSATQTARPASSLARVSQGPWASCQSYASCCAQRPQQRQWCCAAQPQAGPARSTHNTPNCTAPGRPPEPDSALAGCTRSGLGHAHWGKGAGEHSRSSLVVSGRRLSSLLPLRAQPRKLCVCG